MAILFGMMTIADVLVLVVVVVISTFSFGAYSAIDSDFIALDGGIDGRIIPVPSAPQLRYQSTDFVGKLSSHHIGIKIPHLAYLFG